MTGPARAGGPPADARGRALNAERLRLLVGVARALDGPMQLLGFVWLVLLVLDFTRGLSGFLRTLNLAIWGLFVLQFVVEFVIAPRKRQYLERHWLTAVSLLVPALRIFRILRAMRVLRLAAGGPGAQLVRVVGSINRGMAALRRTMGRRGIGFVSLLTLIVTFAGAAGMFTLERGAAGGGLPTYGSAVWWTSMIMTTLGSE